MPVFALKYVNIFIRHYAGTGRSLSTFNVALLQRVFTSREEKAAPKDRWPM